MDLLQVAEFAQLVCDLPCNSSKFIRTLADMAHYLSKLRTVQLSKHLSYFAVGQTNSGSYLIGVLGILLL